MYTVDRCVAQAAVRTAGSPPFKNAAPSQTAASELFPDETETLMSTLLIDDSHPGIRILTMNRPERLNALDGPSIDDLIAAVRECSAPGRDVRVIVLRGAGRAFSAGARTSSG